MKNIFKGKINFSKFFVALIILFSLVIAFNAGRFFWDSRHISRQNLSLLTQKTYAPSSVGSMQIFAEDAKDDKGIAKAAVSAALYDKGSKKIAELCTGELKDGYFAGKFEIPKLTEGQYEIRATVNSSIGKDDIIKAIDIKNEKKLLITTDKPMYKPGQIMNYRVLSLDASSLIPNRDQEIIVMITDPKDNKIFKKSFKTSNYGIIGGSFAFADELTMGNYKIKAQAQGLDGEKSVEVKNYSLPKFEILFKPDQDLTKEQTKISGVVTTRYFFGKPADNSQVKLKMDFDGQEKELSGSTDQDGKLLIESFINPAPDAQRISMSIEATDKNGNKAYKEEAYLVSQDGILVELYPEAGKLKPGLANEIIYISTYPDGKPARTNVFMAGEKLREFATNELGVAKFEYTPDTGAAESRFTLNVKDGKRSIQKDFILENDQNKNGYVLLRTDKAMYAPGDTLKINVQATNNRPVSLEFIQQGSVIYSDYLEIKKGLSEKEIALPDNVFGTIELRASQIFRKGGYFRNISERYKLVSDSRIILADCPKDLAIKAELDKKIYAPGEEAKISFEVKDKDGNLQNSAIGLKIVDEALLALQKDDSQFAKGLFMLDEDIVKDSKSVNGYDLAGAADIENKVVGNQLLQAILAGLSGESVSFANAEIDNSQAWKKYQQGKKVLVNKILLIVILVFLVFSIRYWWNISLLASQARAVLAIWGGSFLAYLFTLLAKVMIDQMDSDIITFGFAEDFWEWLSDIEYLGYIFFLLFILALISYRAYKVRLDKNRMAVFCATVLIGLISLSFLLNQLVEGSLKYQGDDLLSFLAFLLIGSLWVGLLSMLAARKIEIAGHGVFSWSMIFVVGFSLAVFFPGMAAMLYVFVAIFAIIFYTKNSSIERAKTEERIVALEQELASCGKSKELIELEMILLRKDMGRNAFFASAGKVLLAVIGFIFIAVFILMIFSLGNARYKVASPYTPTHLEDPLPTSAGFSNSDPYGAAGIGVKDIALGDNKLRTPRFLEAIDGTDKQELQPQTSEGEISISPAQTDGQAKEEYQAAKRVRQFFPEAMFWQAELIAQDGQADITVPIADSITRWKLSALVNALTGKVGSAESTMVAFQDFFIDFDLPENLTKGDELELPITVYNYLDSSQRVKVSVRNENWFQLLSPNDSVIDLASNESKQVFFRLKFASFGNYVLHIDGLGTKLSDAVEKPLKILPFGQRISQPVASESLTKDSNSFHAIFPEKTIPGTQNLYVKIYPTVFSQIVEGLDSILRFPSGCFEQTSSSLYPDILVLKYLKKTGKDLPEIRKKAEDFIAQGIQRILTYEIEPGGFSYFGDEPSETILSAYGLMEFNEAKDVVFIDEGLIERTKKFLLARQKSDGSFEMEGGHQGGLTGNSDLAKNTYVIWALSEADPKDTSLAKSIGYLKKNIPELKSSSYALALAANAFANFDKNADYTKEAIRELKQKAQTTDDNTLYYTLDHPNHYGSWGWSGEIEVTALASMAFNKTREADHAQKLVDRIIKKKDNYGTWGSTQATILALKALSENETSKKIAANNTGKIKINLNSRKEKSIEISPENSDILQTITFSGSDILPVNTFQISKEGKIDATLEVIKDYYQDFSAESQSGNSALSIDMDINYLYNDPDTDTNGIVMRKDMPISFNIEVDSSETIKNAVAIMQIPAGFEVNSKKLACLTKKSDGSDCPSGLGDEARPLSRYEIKKDRVILYFDELQADRTIYLDIPMTPQFRGMFKILPIRLYAYYDPSQEAFSAGWDDIIIR